MKDLPLAVVKAIQAITKYLRQSNMEQAIINKTGGASFRRSRIYVEPLPIETAPKDGTWILLYPKDGNGVICTGAWATWRDGNSGWAAGGGWYEADDVSHWLPITATPPDADIDGRGECNT